MRGRGEFSHLDEALELLSVGGIYFIDDLLPQPNWPEGHAPKVPALIDAIERKPGFADGAPGLVVRVHDCSKNRVAAKLDLTRLLQQRDLACVVDVVLHDAVQEDVVRHAGAQRSAARVVGGLVELGLRERLDGSDELLVRGSSRAIASRRRSSVGSPTPASLLRSACTRPRRAAAGRSRFSSSSCAARVPRLNARLPRPRRRATASMPSRIALSGEPCHGSPSCSRWSWSTMRAISV